MGCLEEMPPRFCAAFFQTVTVSDIEVSNTDYDPGCSPSTRKVIENSNNVKKDSYMKILCLGDAMIPARNFREACAQFSLQNKVITDKDWETDWNTLQNRRSVVEKNGPEAEPVLPEITNADKETEMMLILFAPVSAEAMDSLPNLRIIGASRAGLENIDVQAATERGILVHNIMGRNAHAVSDFAIGLMFAEARNIARSHLAITKGVWRKEFVNSDFIPELSGKTLGLVGFGYIGRLVAEKLSGFKMRVLVHDPFVSEDHITSCGAERVSLEELCRESDFISIHARMTKETEGLIGKHEIGMMKPTAILVNTARARIVDEDALYNALKNRDIGGAALDVFPVEPIEPDSRWLELDNVTLTTHIAGTTADALGKSPYLLVDDINTLLTGGNPKFLVNTEVLEKAEVKKWLASLI
ncbi:2-hydroxyacid dehydrogenase [Candidatus Latescibacterota bacterium]